MKGNFGIFGLLLFALTLKLCECKHSKKYRHLNLDMIHLHPKKDEIDDDRKLMATLIPKAIQDSGIKAYPEFKYKNIIGGAMNIILPKSRPYVVYNTYPITKHRVDSHSNYPHIPMLSNVPQINI